MAADEGAYQGQGLIEGQEMETGVAEGVVQPQLVDLPAASLESLVGGLGGVEIGVGCEFFPIESKIPSVQISAKIALEQYHNRPRTMVGIEERNRSNRILRKHNPTAFLKPQYFHIRRQLRKLIKDKIGRNL